MALETASYVANLVATNPDGGDARSTADDHLRLIKAALTRTFPKLDGAVSLSQAQIAYLNDVSSSVQAQINALRDGSATVNAALYANSASFATRASHAASASFATVAATANSASYAALAGQAASASFATLARTANSASFATFAGHAASASFATLATAASHATTATNATTATSATNATNATSADNATTLGGFAPNQSAGASTAAIRNSAGDLFARYFNSSISVASLSAAIFIGITNNDGYLRPITAAAAGANLTTRNISGRTGTAKTLSTSTPSGGSNGDIWYRYS